MKIKFQTSKGSAILGESLSVLKNVKFIEKYKNKVQLILTSPPFPLVNKKKYGNLNGKEYINWIKSYAKPFHNILKDDGSLVIEIGNTWNKDSATMSTVPIEALLELKKEGGFHLCQEFICNNPNRLPGPAEWVTKKRIRVKDSYTRIWWLSKSENPKSDNKKVLLEYSDSMKKLIKRKSYNSGLRPSEHSIGEKSFLKTNKGSISSNFLNYDTFSRLLNEGGENSLSISNIYSKTQKKYQEYCVNNGLKFHPARMPEGLVKYFVQFLSDEKDLVLDPFSGSNTTGSICEIMKRKWISIEIDNDYIEGSKGRFLK